MRERESQSRVAEVKWRHPVSTTMELSERESRVAEVKWRHPVSTTRELREREREREPCGGSEVAGAKDEGTR